jgi:CheY-like chemotaxis protein
MAHKHPAVLIVDDDDEPRDNLAALIRAEGYAVDTAGKGQEALEKLRSGTPPCIILMDLMMPDMDGSEFRQLQLSDPAFRHIPVVLYSGSSNVSDYAERLNAVAFAEKPTELARLMVLIRKHCLK